MVDASFLALPDGQGGTWWRPSSLEDIHATPDRVLTLFRYYRMGQLAREHPFDWWRRTDTGKPEFAHLYPASFVGEPDKPARCGAPAPAAAYERTDGKYPCAKCRAIDQPQNPAASPGAMRFVAQQE